MMNDVDLPLSRDMMQTSAVDRTGGYGGATLHLRIRLMPETVISSKFGKGNTRRYSKFLFLVSTF